MPPLRSKSDAEGLELNGETDRKAGGLKRRRGKGKGDWRVRRNDVVFRYNGEGNDIEEVWL